MLNESIQNRRKHNKRQSVFEQAAAAVPCSNGTGQPASQFAEKKRRKIATQ